MIDKDLLSIEFEGVDDATDVPELSLVLSVELVTILSFLFQCHEHIQLFHIMLAILLISILLGLKVENFGNFIFSETTCAHLRSSVSFTSTLHLF